jgi:glycine cleavage system H protein
MKIENSRINDLYYTMDHEWIDFHGSVAYTGICHFKLTGFKQIQEIVFSALSGLKKKGEVIATLRYNDYLIAAHMPVDGKILNVNEKLLNGGYNMLLDCAESTGWIALISPILPHERHGLLLPKQYQMNGKSKYAKS